MRVRLLHWKAAEAAGLQERLTRAGFEVEYDEAWDSALMKAWRTDPPGAFVIDLSRLPSHGREIAVALRQSKETRAVPVVFCDGVAEKVAAIRELLPDASYCSAHELAKTLKSVRPLEAAVRPAEMMKRYGTRTAGQKLGIEQESRVAVVNGPPNVERVLGELAEGVELVDEGGAVTLCFVHSVDGLRVELSRVRGWASETKLWILWRKKGAAGHSGVTDGLVRETGIELGLVDYKICSVDEVWTGMLFAARRL